MALIADLTATTSCDHADADAVVRAVQRAIICGTEMRLVVTSQHVSHAFSPTGLDRLVPIYPSLEAARAASTAAERLPPRRQTRQPVPSPARAGGLSCGAVPYVIAGRLVAHERHIGLPSQANGTTLRRNPGGRRLG
jgi:acyl-CoA synthetase (NDP forming)